MLTWLLLFAGYSVAGQPGATDTESTRSNPQCGHYAILHCCQLLGVPIEMKWLLEQLPPRENGHSMLELLQILERIGLRAEGRSGSIESLREGTFPVIAHTSKNHFIAIERVTEDAVLLLDGWGRRQVWALERFRKEWDGKMLRVLGPQPERPLPDCPDVAKVAPRMAFDTLFIDQGLISLDKKKVEYVFRFRNLGSADLIIESVRTSCRCLESSKPDKPIPPGGTGQIALSYFADERGAFLQTAYVHSNDPCQSVIRLSAAGNTDRRITADPELVELGRIPFGQIRSALCTILSVSDLPVSILSATCDLPGCKVEHFELTPQRLQYLKSSGARILGNPTNAHLLRLTMVAQENTPGPLKGRIEVATNIKDFERIIIPVHGEVISPLYLAPEVLYFGEVGETDQIKQMVKVVARDGKPFRILGIDPQDAGLACTFGAQLQPGKCDLQFAGTGSAAIGLAGKVLTIRAESEGVSGEITLPLRIYARTKSSS
jgi:predicted double-glycine peptidase